MLRGRSIELSQRFPGGTWVRVRGLPLEAGDLTVRSIFDNFGEVVSGPPPRHVEGDDHQNGGQDPQDQARQGDPPEF